MQLVAVPDSQPPVAPQLASKSSTIGPHVATRGGPLLACTSNHYWPPTIGPCEAQAVGLMKAALSGPSINQSLKKNFKTVFCPMMQTLLFVHCVQKKHPLTFCFISP